jgi:potassium channel LctB
MAKEGDKTNEIKDRLGKFIRQFIYIIIGTLVLTIILWAFYKLSSGIKILQTAFGLLFGVSGFLFTILLLILPFLLIRRGMKYLLNHEGVLIRLILGYLIVIFVIIFLFSQLYSISETFKMGYLTRGQCYDTFDKVMIDADPLRSHNYLYFSSVTFFTVGYGDICPMGINKTISVVNSLIGHIFTTIILVIALSSFLEYRKERENNKGKKK